MPVPLRVVLTPAEQEVVFLGVSGVNGCKYCTAAHSMIADKKSGVAPDVLDAIRTGNLIPDVAFVRLYALTTEMIRTQGRPTAGTVQAFLDAGFEERTCFTSYWRRGEDAEQLQQPRLATQLDDVFSAYKVA